MRRRAFLGLMGAAAAWPLRVRAQANIPRVGYFWTGFPDPNVGLAGLRQGLQERGYVLGRNLVLEEPYAEGDVGRTRALIAELLALGVDVLVAGDWALIQAHALSATVPIVGVAPDFVGVGLAANLSRPGGNVTGLSVLSAEFAPKWLELLKAAVPKLNRVAFLAGFSGLDAEEEARLNDVAPRFGVTLTHLDIYHENLEASLAAITSASFDGLIVADELAGEYHIPRIVAHAAQNRMPAIYGFSTAVAQCGLMSLFCRFLRNLAAGCGLCRPHPQRREARRPADRAGDRDQVRRQPQDRSRARARYPPDPARRRRRGDRVRRRAFLAALGAAAAWPFAALAQAAKTPVVGFLHSASRAENAKRLEAFLKGLREQGFAEGGNIAIEYRWADGRAGQLEALAADLVRRQVAVIAAAGSGVAGVAAKKATDAIPIVFATGADPVALGLVASLGHPGGNVTGATSLNALLGAKRLSLMREIMPGARRCFTLINPTSPLAEPFLANLESGAAALGVSVEVLRATSEAEIEAAFASLPETAGSMFISSPDAFFYSRRDQIVAPVARRALPAMFDVPEYVEAGALASYGNDFLDAMRLAGVYVGRILKGAKPAELPVVQAEKFVLALNLTTAHALGFEIPPLLLASADEVIE